MSGTVSLALDAAVLCAADRADLTDAIEQFEGVAVAIPCRTGALWETAYWISDDPDDQILAARACADCPVKVRCARFGLAWPAEAGVFGGLTERARHSQRAVA
jgi:hypothetical protein